MYNKIKKSALLLTMALMQLSSADIGEPKGLSYIRNGYAQAAYECIPSIPGGATVGGFMGGGAGLIAGITYGAVSGGISHGISGMSTGATIIGPAGEVIGDLIGKHIVGDTTKPITRSLTGASVGHFVGQGIGGASGLLVGAAGGSIYGVYDKGYAGAASGREHGAFVGGWIGESMSSLWKSVRSCFQEDPNTRTFCKQDLDRLDAHFSATKLAEDYNKAFAIVSLEDAIAESMLVPNPYGSLKDMIDCIY